MNQTHNCQLVQVLLKEYEPRNMFQSNSSFTLELGFDDPLYQHHPLWNSLGWEHHVPSSMWIT